MTRIHVECPECNGVFNVKAIRAGHRVACKLCGRVVRVPLEDEGVEPPQEAKPPPNNSNAPETRPVLTRMSFGDSEDTVSVRTRRSRSGPQITVSNPRPLLLLGGAVLLLIVIYVLMRTGQPPTPGPIPPPPVAPTTPGVTSTSPF
uniref:Uncharacterized protein n=1 Tax=Schlesneria paludicola TaxID=360056 RepID=A0A7C2JYT0_9PLAN